MENFLCFKIAGFERASADELKWLALSKPDLWLEAGVTMVKVIGSGGKVREYMVERLAIPWFQTSFIGVRWAYDGIMVYYSPEHVLSARRKGEKIPEEFCENLVAHSEFELVGA